MPETNPFESPKAEILMAESGRGDATIRIRRQWQYQDFVRRYLITVNNVPREKIAVNQTILIPVEAGTVSIVASIDWAKTAPMYLEIQAGEIIDIEVSGRLKGWRLLFAGYASLFTPHQWLELKRL
ncbi:hypothetical protein ACYFX5_10255 [Bremerella sp. T1]|uniref:hypothetical protein n=1 Tax=Bremerella sp. TYQ1 TaxID=3119568 RepID=UPI001CC96D32|nr:hypothetical protein [Bremerella volcania]UBM38631.1 hypothetical protein LA756_12200 [Bremerella volcania]